MCRCCSTSDDFHGAGVLRHPSPSIPRSRRSPWHWRRSTRWDATTPARLPCSTGQVAAEKPGRPPGEPATRCYRGLGGTRRRWWPSRTQLREGTPPAHGLQWATAPGGPGQAPARRPRLTGGPGRRDRCRGSGRSTPERRARALGDSLSLRTSGRSLEPIAVVVDRHHPIARFSTRRSSFLRTWLTWVSTVRAARSPVRPHIVSCRWPRDSRRAMLRKRATVSSNSLGVRSSLAPACALRRAGRRSGRAEGNLLRLLAAGRPPQQRVHPREQLSCGHGLVV